MSNHFYDPVGSCIYCGRTTLPHGVDRFTDEHIIPLGLGGTRILPEASCVKCQRTINREIETPILFHEWQRFRDKHKFPTRNPKARRERSHVSAPSLGGTT